MNINQQKAVTAPLGATMVVAGPGSGKTFVIVERINYMINHLNCSPNEILVITFTKAAAEEMKFRYITKYGDEPVVFGTFHSTFYRILQYIDPVRYNATNLLTSEQRNSIVIHSYKRLNLEDEIDNFIDKFNKNLTKLKSQVEVDFTPTEIPKEVFEIVYKEYDRHKKEHNKFDFDDMLLECYYLLQQNSEILKHFQQKYKYILIDEFQDINAVQFETIRLLRQNNNNIFIVGDTDQSIYSFRGSRPEFLLQFDTYFNNVEQITLDINYRSVPAIINYSNRLILCNKNRYDKVMTAHKTGLERPIIINCKDVANQIEQILNKMMEFKQNGYSFDNMAIIYRTNMQSRPIIDKLLAKNINFQIKDEVSSLYTHWLVKDLLAYFKLTEDLTNSYYLKRIINKPTRFIANELINRQTNLLQLSTHKDLNKRQQESLEQLIIQLKYLKTQSLEAGLIYIKNIIGYKKYLASYAGFKNISVENLYELFDEIMDSAKSFDNYLEWELHLKKVAESMHNGKDGKDAITLTTMHSAKGLEYDIVFIIDVIDTIIPHYKDDLTVINLEEERRLFYVGLTRACKHLFIFIPKIRYNKKVKPSPFLDDMLLEELKVGDKVKHRVYGSGLIVNIKENQAGIKFKLFTKTVDYKLCLKNRIIELED
ncbi:MAG: hypothetical protein ATN33_06375 [Epulopiscium sp. Nele67-Bin001]|nr:MAG: hypothetical protein ATN33_06375 [Epulopiscium sp. Nele67-Bin001]